MQPLTTMPAGSLIQMGTQNTHLAGEAQSTRGAPSRRHSGVLGGVPPVDTSWVLHCAFSLLYDPMPMSFFCGQAIFLCFSCSQQENSYHNATELQLVSVLTPDYQKNKSCHPDLAYTWPSDLWSRGSLTCPVPVHHVNEYRPCKKTM